MTAFQNVPDGTNIVAFPADRKRQPSSVGGGAAVLDFMLAQAKDQVDIGGWYHEAAVEEERARQVKGRRR
jgi:hypothetical protein